LKRNLLEKISYGVIVAAMLVMCVLYFAQVIFRYVLELPLAWTGEVSVLAMLWLTFVGSAALVRSEGFVSVPLLKLRGKTKIAVSLVADIFAAVILSVLVYYSGFLAFTFREDILPATGFSRALVYLAICCGALLMLLCFVHKAWTSVRTLVSTEE
jgi:TRAP-type C4-dicarboxylate transport system permease small subunit